MRRSLVLIAAIAVATVSCASGADTSTSAAEQTSTTVAVPAAGGESTTSSSGESSTSTTTVPPSDTEAPPAESPPIDGQPAPDFTLALGDGGEFTLSAEQKPVYLVFWAEW